MAQIFSLGVAMVWITRENELIDDGRGKALLVMGRMRWSSTRDRPAMRAEILDSIKQGMPGLLMTPRDDQARQDLRCWASRRAAQWLPAQ